ncbi:hypothetical protein [Streptomyces mirabilis]|uniref:hypothetical protein n=1 Tax=Streptomyces mirabilis TaxID=68239 RepID=UPI003662D7B1
MTRSTPAGPFTVKQRIIAAAACGGIVAAAVIGIDRVSESLSTPAAPSCAKHQDGLSLTEQSDCLTQVSNWCAKNDPNGLPGACEDKVYGYVPGKPSDDNDN